MDRHVLGFWQREVRRFPRNSVAPATLPDTAQGSRMIRLLRSRPSRETDPTRVLSPVEWDLIRAWRAMNADEKFLFAATLRARADDTLTAAFEAALSALRSEGTRPSS